MHLIPGRPPRHRPPKGLPAPRLRRAPKFSKARRIEVNGGPTVSPHWLAFRWYVSMLEQMVRLRSQEGGIHGQPR